MYLKSKSSDKLQDDQIIINKKNYNFWLLKKIKASSIKRYL